MDVLQKTRIQSSWTVQMMGKQYWRGVFQVFMQYKLVSAFYILTRRKKISLFFKKLDNQLTSLIQDFAVRGTAGRVRGPQRTRRGESAIFHLAWMNKNHMDHIIKLHRSRNIVDIFKIYSKTFTCEISSNLSQHLTYQPLFLRDSSGPSKGCPSWNCFRRSAGRRPWRSSESSECCTRIRCKI